MFLIIASIVFIILFALFVLAVYAHIAYIRDITQYLNVISFKIYSSPMNTYTCDGHKEKDTENDGE